MLLTSPQSDIQYTHIKPITRSADPTAKLASDSDRMEIHWGTNSVLIIAIIKKLDTF